LDFQSIRQIAETHKGYFPKDFIAQCLKHCHNYHYDDDLQIAWRLFLDAFTWFVEEFGPASPGYYGLGKSKEEVVDQQGDIEVLGENLHDILDGIAGVFQNHSLVAVRHHLQ
jgi:hypothetical protein